MARAQLDLYVFPAHCSVVRLPWLQRVAQQALEVADPRGRAGASVVIADDATLRSLNQRYRGDDAVTDVLSFGNTGPSSHHTATTVLPFPEPPSASWGEIVISYPQAGRQALERGLSVELELAHLIAHGFLHLVGHDHEEPEEARAMQTLEHIVLSRLGYLETQP